MRVLLVPPKNNYPFPKPSIDIFGQGFPYIAGALKKAGHEVFGVNINHLWCQDSAQLTLEMSLRNAIEKYQPHLIGVGGLSANYSFVRDAIRFIRQISPEVPTVCGGGIITYDHHYIFTDLRPDFAINGEGEETIVALAHYLEKGGDINDIANISYWENDKPQYTKTAYSNTKLEDLPWPDYSPFDIESYLDGFNQADHIFTYTRPRPRIMPVSLGRSCPFKCTFCCHTTGPTYRGRSVDNAIDEIVYFYDKYHFNILLVCDELFSTRKERIKEFCTKIKKIRSDLKMDFDWTCCLRVTNVDKDVLKEMNDAGCFYVGYGFESASPTVLKSMKKGITVEQISRAIKLTDEAGLGVQGNFIFGDPAETAETMQETLEFFNTYCTDKIVHLGHVVPYPGSKLFEHCINNGIIKDKRQYYDQIGGLGIFFINMTKLPNDIFFNLSNNITKITTPSVHDYLALKEAIILSCEQAGQFEFDLNAPLSARRFLFNINVICPHCNKEVTYLYPLRTAKQDQSETLRLFCSKCHKRFIVNISDYISGKPINDVDNSTEALFAAGNYASVAMNGKQDEWQTFAALGLLGKSKEAIEGLSRFDNEESRFYTAVAHWINGIDEAAKRILQNIPTPHAQNLLALISKPQIQVIAQTLWKDKDFLDHKFNVRQIGLRHIDSPQAPFENIHKHYDPNNPPDFYFCNMIEDFIQPLNLQELRCPVFGATKDFDVHIQNLYPWLSVFDELLVTNHQDWYKVHKIANLSVATFPRQYGIPSSLPLLPKEQRDTDFLLSGTMLDPLYPDRARLLHKFLQISNINLRYNDDFILSDNYYAELARSKVSHTHYTNGVFTSELEALAMGCVVVTQKNSTLSFYTGEMYGVVTYDAEYNNLPEAVQGVVSNWNEFEQRARKGAELVRREFSLNHVISQYLRFLTFLAAKPRTQRRIPQNKMLRQKRNIAKRGFLFPPAVNAMMLNYNLHQWKQMAQSDVSPKTLIDMAREAVLFLDNDIDIPAIAPANMEKKKKFLHMALSIYRTGIKCFPKSLVLRFNFIRTAFHFGSPEDVLEALQIAEDMLQAPMSYWEIDVMEDVFPWDFFSTFFNYRRYFDEITVHLMNNTQNKETLIKLIMASVHYYAGHYTNNIEHFQQAVQMDTEFPFYTYHYARHLLAQDGVHDRQKAIVLLTQLAQYSMLFEEVFSLLENLRSLHKVEIPEFDTIASFVNRFRCIQQKSGYPNNHRMLLPLQGMENSISNDKVSELKDHTARVSSSAVSAVADQLT